MTLSSRSFDSPSDRWIRAWSKAKAVNASEKLLADPDRVRRIGHIREGMRNADAAHEATRPRAFGQLANLDARRF
jgi:hypothetical protein